MGCLKILRADSPDLEIVKFISSHKSFDLYGAYYAKNCLEYIGAEVQVKDGMLGWHYHSDVQIKPFDVPSTPLVKYFRCEVYGMYGSSILSSPLSAALKRIELGAKLDSSLTKWAYSLLKASVQRDLMVTFMALEILKVIKAKGYPATLPASNIQEIKEILSQCTTRKGYVAHPTSNSMSIESIFAGHEIAKFLGISNPLGLSSFIELLQNSNGGFRRTPFGGISTLEYCYLALRIFSDDQTL